MNILELKRKLLSMSGPQMSMGGGGGSGSGTQTQISELPEWARGYAKSTLEKGAALTEKPYQAYDQNRIAGFSPLQQQSQEDAANMQTNAGVGQGMGIANAAAMQGLTQNYQSGPFQNQFQAPGEYQAGRFGAPNVRAQNLQNFQMGPAQQVSTQSFAQPGSAESYMSPYMQNVVDVQQREARRASDITGQQNAARAVGQGAFGGSRAALVEAERQRNLGTQLGDIQATGQQAAYQQAQQQFNQEQQARLAAQQANQQAGLTTGQANLNALLGVQNLGAGQNLQAQQLNQAARLQAQQLGEQSRQFGAGQGLQAASLGAQYGQAAEQLGEQSRQFGANLGLQGLNTALQGASTLGQLGGQQFQQGMDINKLQNAYGGQQQALQQQGLTQAYEDFQNQQNYPYKQLGFFSDLIRGLPLGQQTATQMYTPNPSAAQNVAALGAGAYGLSKFMAEGGMAYADGGSVDSKDNVERIVSQLSDQQLQQAAQAAQARGDMDQLEAIQSEMAMRASERNGLASAVTPQMVQGLAGGGILAFDGEEGSYIPEGTADYAGVPNQAALKEWLEAQKAIAEFKASPAMTREERAKADKENFDRFQKFAGEDPYAPMAERLRGFETDRSRALEEGKGLAALQAIPAILQGGNAARGIGAGIGALGGNLAQVAKADAAEKRALASMDFNIKDAQRKERMGLTKDAIASTTDAQKDRIAADKAQLDALKARAKGATDAGRAFRTSGAGGAGKGPKIAEQLAAAEIEHETNPTDATLKKVTALRRAVSLTKTSDYGPGRAGAAADAIAVKLKDAETKALEKLGRTPDYREATPAMRQVMEDKVRADIQRRVSFEDAAPAAGGAVKNDYSSLWTNPSN